MSGTSTLKQPIEIFYAGTHTDFRRKVVTVSQRELQESVAHFNASGQRLPLVVGHPDSEEENFGEGTRLAMVGDRVVIAEVANLDPSFRKIVNSGELPKVSAKIRLPGHPRNTSGGIEFQHAGFFGKSRVALDKLREAAFCADDKEFWFMSGYEQEQEAEFAAQKREFEREVAAFRRAQAIEPELEKLVRDGKLLPGEKAGFVALFAGMPDDFELTFAAPSGEITQPGGEFLKTFLTNLKPRVNYREVSAPSDKQPASATFAAPRGYTADPDGLDAHAQVLEFCRENNLDPVKDYTRAAIQVLG